MRSQGLDKRMSRAEELLVIHEPEWVQRDREVMTRWLVTVEGAAELYAEYVELLEAEGSHAALLGLERGREVTLAMVDSLWSADQGAESNTAP